MGRGERCAGHVVAASDLHLSGISKNGTLNCVNNVQISSFETRNIPSQFNCINSHFPCSHFYLIKLNSCKSNSIDGVGGRRRGAGVGGLSGEFVHNFIDPN